MLITTRRVQLLFHLPVCVLTTTISLLRWLVGDATLAVSSAHSTYRLIVRTVLMVSIKIQHRNASPMEQQFRLRIGEVLGQLNLLLPCLEQHTQQQIVYLRLSVETQPGGTCGDALKQPATEEP